MSDFKDLQDDVLDLCQELQGQTDFTLTRVKRVINRGYYNFVRATKCIEDTISITTVADQVLYDSDDAANMAYIFKIIGVKYITDSSTENGKILLPYPGGYNALPKNIQSGEPTWYYTKGITSTNIRAVGTNPVIDVSSETLELHVYRSPTADLSADANEPDIDEMYRDALVFYAVWRLFHSYSHKNRDWRAKAVEHKQLYDEMVNDYIGQNFDESADALSNQTIDMYEEDHGGLI